MADYLFQVLNSTVNTQAMPKHTVGPGAMKIGVKGEFISTLVSHGQKLRNVGLILVHSVFHLLLLQKYNFLLKFNSTGSLVVKTDSPSLYTQKNRERKAKYLNQDQERHNSLQLSLLLIVSIQ